MGSKTVIQIIDDFIRDLIQNYNCGEDSVTSITISPHLFGRMVTDYHKDLLDIKYRDEYEFLRNPPTKATITTQMGNITIKKDLTSLIKDKQERVDKLLKEIEELKRSE